jgi:hypothetical protein
MEMLEAISRGWLSYDFDVSDRTGGRVGHVEVSNWRENAKLEVEGTRYEATHRSGHMEFVLSRADGSTVLVAKKPSAWKERLSFEHEGSRYELEKESAWRRAFVLSRDRVGAVGSLRPGSMFIREWSAELPEEFPPEVRVFVRWLAVLLWRRSDSASAGGAAAASS